MGQTISIFPILMAMSFHLLVRSSGPLRAQDGSPLQRPEQEFAGESPNPVLGFFGEYCAIVSKTNPATLIAVDITPGLAVAVIKTNAPRASVRAFPFPTESRSPCCSTRSIPIGGITKEKQLHFLDLTERLFGLKS